MRAVLKKSSQFILILAISFGWIFSGWPQIFNFPPEIQKAQATHCTSSPCSFTTVETHEFVVPAYETLTITVWGGGGGGGGAGTAGVTNGGDGGQSSFASPTAVLANGGVGGAGDSSGGAASGGGGGTASGGDTNTTGATGDSTGSGATTGGSGGDAPNGGTGGAGGAKAAGSGGNTPGAGGGGGGFQSGPNKRAGGGGGSGGYSTKTFTAGQLTESSSIDIVVGAAGTAGAASTGNAGGAGARGQVDISWTDPVSNTPPDKPTNSSPSDTATDIGVNPTLTGSTYADDDSDPHADTEWRVDNDSNFSSPVWTRTAGSGEESTVINTSNGTFANELSGETTLAFDTQYYWQVRYSDGTDWSDWSDATSFTTVGVVVSITIDPTNFAYGNMDNNTASTTLTLFGGGGIVIENTGNVNVDIDIFGADTANWTLAGSTGSNQYVHQFCNDTEDDCSSPPTNFTALTTSPQSFATGVGPSGTTALQLRIITPNPSTVFSPQSAAVTVQATAAE